MSGASCAQQGMGDRVLCWFGTALLLQHGVRSFLDRISVTANGVIADARPTVGHVWCRRQAQCAPDDSSWKRVLCTSTYLQAQSSVAAFVTGIVAAPVLAVAQGSPGELCGGRGG